MSNMKSDILVVGDIMLDITTKGTVNRISPEAPVPVFEEQSTSYMLGGAANVAANVASIGYNPYLISMHGALNNVTRNLVFALDKSNIRYNLVKDPNRPTTVKERFKALEQQILRRDIESTQPISIDIEEKIIQHIYPIIKDVNVVILSDYGKGLLTKSLCTYIISTAINNGVYVVVDPKGFDWSKYTDADFITPNEREFTLVDRTKNFNIGTVIRTEGPNGVTVLDDDSEIHIPAYEVDKVHDVTGAGDTFIAIFAVELSKGVDLIDAVRVANMAAGLVVQKHDTAFLNKAEYSYILETIYNSE